MKVENADIEAFLHCNDLTYLNNGEEELSKYKKGDKIKVKVLEIKETDQKIRVGHRQTKEDPFDFFKDKNKNQTITVKVINADNKGLKDVILSFRLRNQKLLLMQLMQDPQDGQVVKN